VVLADFLRLPFAAEVFDGIWAMATLLHVPRTHLSSVLSEIKRVLKPESVLFISVKKGHGRKRDANSRYFEFYQMEEWLDRLEKAGFAIMKAEEVLETRTIQTGNSQHVTWIQCLAQRL
jgi:ubiquinone/menaquinone biosynthesis C-methylase UbiE